MKLLFIPNPITPAHCLSELDVRYEANEFERACVSFGSFSGQAEKEQPVRHEDKWYTAFMSVKVLVQRLRTPHHVQRWLYTLKYNTEETMRSLHGVVRTQTAHCLEGAMSAAAILEHHGYPPILLDFDSADLLGHDLFLFKHNGRYGTVGWSRDYGLNGRNPMYKTIRQLVQSYAAPYIDAKACITRYAVFDLRDLRRGDWRTSGRNVWYVEDALRNIPHTRLPQSSKFISYWRKRYLDFKKLYPDRQPSIYRNTQYWF